MEVSIDRRLWIAFGVLFAVVAVASALPTRPLVAVFPAWSLAVLAALAATIAVAVAAARVGWPAEVEP